MEAIKQKILDRIIKQFKGAALITPMMVHDAILDALDEFENEVGKLRI